MFQTTAQIQLKTRLMKTRLFKDNSPPEVDRMIQFTFRAPAARHVFLVGDFNRWNTQAGPMHKGPDGAWHLAVFLRPGRYEYRFFADEAWCEDPAAEQKTVNSLGTENSVRIV